MKGKTNFLTSEFLFTLLGMNRALREYGTEQMIKGKGKEAEPKLTVGTNYGPYSTVNSFLWKLGIQTPKELNKAKNNINKQLYKTINDMEQKKPIKE